MLNILFTVIILSTGFAHADLNVETGGVWQGLNNFRITPDEGTHVDLKLFGQGSFNYYRIEYHQHLSGPHGLRLIYAPLRLVLKHKIDNNIQFNGKVFVSGTETEATYQFNSYRLGYTYTLKSSGKSQIRLGVTAKVRDAEIALKQGSTSSSYNNVGFVPLLYFSYEKPLSSSWFIYTDLDALGAPQGRAIDWTFKVRKLFFSSSYMGVGYRTVEGGADNDKVYTFSWFHYALFELGIKF